MDARRIAFAMAAGAMVLLVCRGASAEKAPLTKAELEETATHIVVGKVRAVYSRTEREGDYEYTRFVAEVAVDEVVKGDGPRDLIYVRYFGIRWVGPGRMPPGPGGHSRPEVGKSHRFYLARHAYDGYHSRPDNDDGGYNVVYGNGVQPPEGPAE